ncbi:MAG: hypothetical protein JW881_19250 [Spirochaetales bacterium]|nr:hypothetical protein [Spirochaetales bacterium]
MKRYLFAVILACMLSTLSHAQYYRHYSHASKIRLAEAYYLVGRQYMSMGKESGRFYMRLAYSIYPGFDPEHIGVEADEPVFIANCFDRINEVEKSFENKEDLKNLLTCRFMRMTGLLFFGERSGVSGFFDSMVFIGENNRFMTQRELAEAMADNTTPRSGHRIMPEELYDYESVIVADAPRTVTSCYGESYVFTIKPREEPVTVHPFFRGKEQTYYFRRDGERFRVFGIGHTAPVVAAIDDAGVSAGIFKAFFDAVDAFLKRDMTGIKVYLNKKVTILPLGTTVDFSEIELTFQGFFDDSGFNSGRYTAADLLDRDNYAVIGTDRFTDLYPEGVYVLIASVRKEYCNGIPFWPGYIYYFFARIDGEWKVIAMA